MTVRSFAVASVFRGLGGTTGPAALPNPGACHALVNTALELGQILRTRRIRRCVLARGAELPALSKRPGRVKFMPGSIYGVLSNSCEPGTEAPLVSRPLADARAMCARPRGAPSRAAYEGRFEDTP